MTARTKTKADGEAPEAAEETQPAEAEPPALCGKPHYLPVLAHLTCTEPAADPDLPPGTPEHEHRHQDGDALYTWQ
ncbi:hypothetical protein ACIRU8_10365 [Streptomyces sp. NPDC101175]|uniref:hypothetical protein n=1 Tax=Streptomyces sp. NPDC101175 TaxID=3366123 RepID=UPI0038346034